MDRWGWMALRAYAPAAFALLGGLVSAWVVAGLQASPLLASLYDLARRAPGLAFLLALGLGLFATYRLLQWERGKGPTCHCGGALGWEHPGIRGRADYRKCWACGRNVNHRHYR